MWRICLTIFRSLYILFCFLLMECQLLLLVAFFCSTDREDLWEIVFLLTMVKTHYQMLVICCFHHSQLFGWCKKRRYCLLAVCLDVDTYL